MAKAKILLGELSRLLHFREEGNPRGETVLEAIWEVAKKEFEGVKG